MKVTVIKYLNVRVGEPSVNAPNYQYLAPGSQLEVIDKIISGDVYDGDDRWLKDEANNYYWIGGTNYDEIKRADSIEINNNQVFNQILSDYPGDGRGIGLAILDSGINAQHPKLKSSIKYYKSFLSNTSLENISEHGTKVASIIHSVSNESDLYCFRVSNQTDNIDNDAVYNALKAINENEALFTKLSLVNLSLDIISDYVPHVQQLVDQLLAKQIVCVVSAGEGLQVNNITNLNNVIKVGVFNSKSTPIQISDQFLLSYLNQEIPTYSINSSELNSSLSRDSAYCAFTTSLLAKYCSSQNKHKISIQDATNYLNSISTPIANSTNILPYKPYKS